VISERIIYSIQGRRLPNFYRRRRDQRGSNYRFWLDHSAHDANLALKNCTKSVSHKWNNFYAVFLQTLLKRDRFKISFVGKSLAQRGVWFLILDQETRSRDILLIDYGVNKDYGLRFSNLLFISED
jgi:hypothetical protein